ncbi:hypothetical protein [Janibacter sp. DB-40]|uniref:hypothetical protein n=1 Tax=Janibacter sp. DB-40 TaxID=3028808 RepID=UPI002406FE3A|nr:hypothetical protein [Janibacter sp. DB-40]
MTSGRRASRARSGSATSTPVRWAGGRCGRAKGAGSVVEDPLPGAELGEVIAEVTRQEWSSTEA